KPIINKIIPILSNYTVDMQEWDIDAFKQLNWKKTVFNTMRGFPALLTHNIEQSPTWSKTNINLLLLLIKT
ncbi:hypothetical protein NXZ28_17875, partial [Escherichia coli]|nr:hypothetical protein [Escherichia coli]